MLLYGINYSLHKALWWKARSPRSYYAVIVWLFLFGLVKILRQPQQAYILFAHNESL